jgi:hypothetical protein
MANKLTVIYFSKIAAFLDLVDGYALSCVCNEARDAIHNYAHEFWDNIRNTHVIAYDHMNHARTLMLDIREILRNNDPTQRYDRLGINTHYLKINKKFHNILMLWFECRARLKKISLFDEFTLFVEHITSRHHYNSRTIYLGEEPNINLNPYTFVAIIASLRFDLENIETISYLFNSDDLNNEFYESLSPSDKVCRDFIDSFDSYEIFLEINKAMREFEYRKKNTFMSFYPTVTIFSYCKIADRMRIFCKKTKCVSPADYWYKSIDTRLNFFESLNSNDQQNILRKTKEYIEYIMSGAQSTTIISELLNFNFIIPDCRFDILLCEEVSLPPGTKLLPNTLSLEELQISNKFNHLVKSLV